MWWGSLIRPLALFSNIDGNRRDPFQPGLGRPNEALGSMTAPPSGEMRDSDADTVIVGGGLAGLTAACYLGRAGRRVTLFEKAPVLGGRGTSQDHDGFQFNRGIHALYTGGAASEVLTDLGVEFSGGSPSDVHALSDGTFYRAPTSGRSFVSSGLFSVWEKLELIRLFTRIARMEAEDVEDVSVQEWLDANVTRPRLRSFLEANARTFVYSAALDVISADVFIRKTQRTLANPIVYVDGGWQTVVDGLQETAEAAGVNVRTGTQVARVEEDAGTVQGVRLQNGETIPASSVVLATTPTQAVSLVPTGSESQLADLVDSMVPARVACLTVALDELPDPEHTVVQNLDEPCFMSTQSVYSRVAPEGAALIYAFKQLDPRSDGDPDRDERDLEALLDEAQPGWRSVLVKRQFLPRIQAVGMLPTAETGGYSGRPGPDVSGIHGLLVAGDWVGPGFLSDASFGSGREAARRILETVSGDPETPRPARTL